MLKNVNFEITLKYILNTISKMFFSMFTVGVLPFASGKNIQNPKGTRGKTSKA